MSKQLLLGDEAIAQAALDAGLSGVYAYPGTPSTEITEYSNSADYCRKRYPQPLVFQRKDRYGSSLRNVVRRKAFTGLHETCRHECGCRLFYQFRHYRR